MLPESLKTITYSPDNHAKLIGFMAEQYQNRSMHYLRWWLDCIKRGGETLWKRTLIVCAGERIVGCTTAVSQRLIVNRKPVPFYYEANTIVALSMRGKGVGRILYNRISQYPDRCVIGMTKAAYMIQRRYSPDNVELAPIRVYITITPHVFGALFNRLFRREPKVEENFPQSIEVGTVEFVAFSSFAEITDWPTFGIWSDEPKQISRDMAWVTERFENIWSAQSYYKYRIVKNGECVGFAVYRMARLYGIPIIAIVDYRCKEVADEPFLFIVANRLAKRHRCGFSICLTSRLYSLFSCATMRVRTPKCIKGMANYGVFAPDVLFTSADSDLDFVYYE